MNTRSMILTLVAFLATSVAARAGQITVRNKTLHEPEVLWVAEYSVGASKAERVKGPFKIVPEDKEKWTKSKFKSFHERWIRWSPDKSKLKKSFSKSSWNNTGSKTGKKSIGSFVGTLTISDYKNKGEFKAKTDTGLWLGQAWADTWDSVWGPISTAGDTLTVFNKTGDTLIFTEYQKDILGDAVRLQGGSDGFEVGPGESKQITKAKLDPGYTSRFLYFRSEGDTLPSSKDASYWKKHKNRTKNCGKITKKIYLYVDKNGDPKAYNHLEWQFKQTGCQLLVGAINTVGKASAVAPLPDAVVSAVGLDAAMQPLEDALNDVGATLVDLQELQDAIESEFDVTIGQFNLEKIEKKLDKLANKQIEVEDLMAGSCFCDDDMLETIEDELEDLGLRIVNWFNLDPSQPGHFHQGFSMTTTFSYKALNVSFTQTFVTDWIGGRKAFFTVGASAGTSIEKAPKVTRSLGLEFYPNIDMDGFLGTAWDFGVSGGGSSFPLEGGASALFGADPWQLPDLTKLVGVGVSAQKASQDPDGQDSSALSAAGGVSYTWAAY